MEEEKKNKEGGKKVGLKYKLHFGQTISRIG